MSSEQIPTEVPSQVTDIGIWEQSLADTLQRIQERGLPIRYGLCGEAADYLARLLNRSGVSLYLVDGHCRGVDHIWVEDEYGFVWDPTASMFTPPPVGEDYETSDPEQYVLYTPKAPRDVRTCLDECTCGEISTRYGGIFETREPSGKMIEVDRYFCSCCRRFIKEFPRNPPLSCP